MKTGIIIQARRGSTRLPDKMTLPFADDKNVLEIIIEKIKKKYAGYPIILATTTSVEDDKLEEIAKENQIQIFRGSENNVLNRFIEAGKKFELENIIRVCADNPFLDTPHIQKLIDSIEKNDIDYASYKNEKGLPVIKTHLGLFTEAVKLNSLKKIEESTSESIYLEHVTNYIYEHKKMFKLNLINLPDYFKNTENIRLTMDTASDFELEKKIFSTYNNLNTRELIHKIKEDKSILNQMQKEINNNKK